MITMMLIWTGIVVVCGVGIVVVHAAAVVSFTYTLPYFSAGVFVSIVTNETIRRDYWIHGALVTLPRGPVTVEKIIAL
jgi:hypothetical protein